MTRLLFIVVFLASFLYTFQANPLPQDAEQSAPSDLDRLANKAKELWNDGVEQLMKNPTLSEAIEKTKSLLDQAGEAIRKETDKIGEKLRD